jgi:hypothetical protein
MNQPIIVLSASQYQITNDKTGEVENEGTTVRYLMTDDLSPYKENVRPVKGRVPAKATLSYEDFDAFTVLPAFYNVELDFTPDSKGNVKVTPTRFQYLGGVSVGKANVKLNRAEA